MATALEICSRKEQCCVIWFLWVKYVSPTKINVPVIQMYGNGLKRPAACQKMVQSV